MKFPTPRGPLSDNLFATLSGKGRHLLPADVANSKSTDDLLADDDLQLSLWACYQLHLGGFDDVDDRWEWDPAVLGFRARLEKRFERYLRHHAPVPPAPRPRQVPHALADLIASQPGPSLSDYVQRRATLGQFRELLMHRSLDYLHGPDPHRFVIPSAAGRPTAALAGIRIDPDQFRVTLTRLGLNPTPGAYLGYLRAITLAANNVTAMFGLHRRLRGALLGELAIVEMNRPLTNRRYANALRRLGADADTRRYFDKLGEVAPGGGAAHEAEAVGHHDSVHDIVVRFCKGDPAQAPNVLFGAAACLFVEARLSEHLVGNWARGRSSLRTLVPSRRRDAVKSGSKSGQVVKPSATRPTDSGGTAMQLPGEPIHGRGVGGAIADRLDGLAR